MQTSVYACTCALPTPYLHFQYKVTISTVGVDAESFHTLAKVCAGLFNVAKNVKSVGGNLCDLTRSYAMLRDIALFGVYGRASSWTLT